MQLLRLKTLIQTILAPNSFACKNMVCYLILLILIAMKTLLAGNNGMAFHIVRMMISNAGKLL